MMNHGTRIEHTLTRRQDPSRVNEIAHRLIKALPVRERRGPVLVVMHDAAGRMLGWTALACGESRPNHLAWFASAAPDLFSCLP